MRVSRWLSLFAVQALLWTSSSARADEPEGAPKEAAAPAPPEATATPPPATPPPAAPPPERARSAFRIDPITDGGVLALTASTVVFSELITGTGEIAPQAPVPTSSLLGLDRATVRQGRSSTWKAVSNVALFGAIGYAVAAPFVSGIEHGPRAAVTDAVIMAESALTTSALTNLAKIAFRRPRPRAYIEREERIARGEPPNGAETNDALSFFSGHASVVAAVAATATYTTFRRHPGSVRAYTVLGLGLALTTLVSVARVRAGEHFPTDVIAGAGVGLAIGTVIPHLHWHSVTNEHLWIEGAATQGGGQLGIAGLF